MPCELLFNHVLKSAADVKIEGEILSARTYIRGLRVVTLGPSANDVDYLAINDAYDRFLLPMNSEQYEFNTDTMGPNPVNGVHVVKLFDKLRRTELFRRFGQIFNIFSRVRMGS
ncbi:hypothetical protein SeLEV6574_g05945, partial [Synchytrium endobioticum]